MREPFAPHLATPAPAQGTLAASNQSSPSELNPKVAGPTPALLHPPIQRQPSDHPSRPPKPPNAAVAPFLIVDDNEINLKLLSAYVSRKSYPFVTAVDGVLAVKAYTAARGRFSCIFMDIQMPRMDGIAAARAIRKYEHEECLDPVTVVALTGLVTEEKQREAEASGINEFFAKPVRLKALDAILERTARPV
jgi:CheY-like chemotaxis protein